MGLRLRHVWCSPFVPVLYITHEGRIAQVPSESTCSTLSARCAPPLAIEREDWTLDMIEPPSSLASFRMAFSFPRDFPRRLPNEATNDACERFLLVLHVMYQSQLSTYSVSSWESFPSLLHSLRVITFAFSFSIVSCHRIILGILSIYILRFHRMIGPLFIAPTRTMGKQQSLG